jgi:hypothetical protein
MVRSTDFSRRFRHCLAAWRTTFVVGVAAAAVLGGCGVDRTGLEAVTLPDGAGDHPGNGDAAVGGGSGGAPLGTGGAGGGGMGGGIVVDGSGGMIGIGGMIGTGGTIVGTGGTIGTGGMIGAGGMIVGTGGMIVGTGGMIVGTGGMIVGTGGATDGGTDAGAGGAGVDGSGVGGTPGVGGSGTGGMGMGGAPGVGGMGPPPVCTPACGPCQRCAANHTCELDPASTWDLAAVSAAVMPDDPNVQGAVKNWDLPSGEIGGVLPDPFVELDFLTTAITPVGHTAPIIDTLLPNWGALMPGTQALINPPGSPVRASDLMAGGKNWQISVFDDDIDASAVPFGETICELGGALTSADFLNGGFTRTNVGSCFSISIKLTCHP